MQSTEHEHEHENEQGPDLWYYWRLVKKGAWIFAITAAVVAAATILITMRRDKVYQATAEVIINPQAPKVLGDSVEVVQLGVSNTYSDSEYYATQLRILTSYSLAEETVRKYGLQHDPRLVGDPKGRSENQLVSDATEALRSHIKVAPVKDSHVFAIAVRDGNPAFAAELANEVTSVYIDQNLTVKRDLTNSAKGFVSKLLDGARKELDDSETALYAYKKDKNILSVSLEDQKNKISKALDAFSTALTDARKKRIELQARRRAIGVLIKGDVSKIPSSFIVDSPLVDKLRAEYLDEQSKLAALEERYGPKHTEVVIQGSRVQAALANLNQAGDVMLRSMDAEIGALQDAENRYAAEVATLTSDAFELGKQEIEYKRLSRDAVNSELQYTQLLKRLNESTLQEQDHANNIRSLDAALVPDVPIEPNLKLAILIGIGLGLVSGLSLVFALDFLDRTVKNQDDLESLVRAPFLGIIPTVDRPPSSERGRPELGVFTHPTSNVAECVRVVRTNVLFCSPDKPIRAMLVTSAGSVEGKTMNVIHLGIAMAQSGQRTLLVDSDMRRPRLHRALSASNERGLSGLIVGEYDAEAAIKSTEVPNLFVLPCGPVPPNPAELLQTERFGAVVAGLTARFDRVIFDSPPLLAVTDAAILARVVDGTLLVVRAGHTTREALFRGTQALRNVNAKVVGTLLNDVNLRNPHYAHYYSYYARKYAEAGPAVSPREPGA